MKNLMQLLRPAYESQLPDVDKLSGEILTQVYAKHLNSTSTVHSSGILLINKDIKPRISLTFNKNEQYLYV